MDKNTRLLLGLTDKHLSFGEDWLEYSHSKGVKAQVIKATLTYIPTHCRNCGIKNQGQIIKNGYHRTYTQLPVFNGRLTLLELKRSRFRCHECHATFHAQTELVEEHHHLSKQLCLQIMLDLKKNVSRKEIAQKHFVSDVTVLRLMEELATSYSPNWRFLPKILCIDEFKSMKSCEGAMSFICVNGETNKILEVLEDRRLTHLTRHFMRYTKEARENVKYLVMDMNASYDQLLKSVFPNAQLVTDRFHIVQQMNRALNQLRIKTMNAFRHSSPLEQKQYRRLKRYWKLLLKDSSELDSQHRPYHSLLKRPLTQTDIVDELLSYDSTLRIAYDTVQFLKYAFTHRDAKRFFEELDTLDPRLPFWFKKKLRFFKKHRQGITNAFSFSFSNGITEGLNNKIKVIKRVAYGYRNFYHFRSRIYIVQGLVFSQD
ncbi:ISL3 family transposase [Candidatus Enterococcus clewellii]|uniref:Transposase IS204/IS1001/IS1096/IS1165 DDE domain-containing protein n=1 Tax=Candidatus Enterococcus clewellii TaxID=1834193 RepID=A0AAQ3VSC0_9ENTE